MIHYDIFFVRREIHTACIALSLAIRVFVVKAQLRLRLPAGLYCTESASLHRQQYK